MRRFRNLIWIMLIGLMALGCAKEKEGPLEKAGEKADEAIEETKETAEEIAEEVKDEIDDATEEQ